MGEIDWSVWSVPTLDGRVLCFQQLRLAFEAIDKWYSDHDRTLPESLDELIEHGYLAEMPVHPFTEERMEYVRDAPIPSGMTRNDFTVGILALEKFWEILREQQEQHSKHIRAINDAFLKVLESPGRTHTYLRLGKWGYLIIEPVPKDEPPQEFVLESE